jgi:hypothetical protein
MVKQTDIQNYGTDVKWWWHLHKIVQAFNARSFTISFAQSNGDLMVKTI